MSALYLRIINGFYRTVQIVKVYGSGPAVLGFFYTFAGITHKNHEKAGMATPWAKSKAAASQPTAE